MKKWGVLGMPTAKPISTISYNTEEFLILKLNELYESHIIQAYQYICHKGEDGDKDHIHLRIEPNKRIDPMDLTEELTEYVLGEDKPRVVRTWRPSKEEDWILYAVHDKDYLRLKYKSGEKGEKLAYDWKDIKVPENYDMEVAFIRARQKLEHTSSHLFERLLNGESPQTLIYEGENVYTVNAINQAVYNNEYYTLKHKFDDVTAQLNDLIDAINDLDYSIEVNEDGKTILKKIC